MVQFSRQSLKQKTDKSLATSYVDYSEKKAGENGSQTPCGVSAWKTTLDEQSKCCVG